MNSRLGWAENGRFLERFRYTIIASQLLNDVPNPGVYKRQTTIKGTENDLASLTQAERTVAFSWVGILVTAAAAFVTVWSIHWARSTAASTSRIWPLILAPVMGLITCSILYMYFRRQWLQWIRTEAVESASTLVAGSQDLDAAVAASMNLIQEVELVCRGYRM